MTPKRRGARRLRLLLVPPSIVVLAVLALGALWPSDPVGTSGRPAAPPYLTVFLVDGLSRAVFEDELAQGHLPNVAALIREGLYVRGGVSAFPSMTGYGYYPLITGEDAARSGILGLRWFDRAREAGNLRSYVGRTYGLMNQDLAASPRTLFEAFREEQSATLNSYCNRGAHRTRYTGWLFTMAKYKGFWWVADLLSAIPLLNKAVAPDWIAVEEQVLALALEDLSMRPKVHWVTFVSPDTYAHVHGMGPRYRELVRKIDALVGEYRAASARLGLDDRVYAFLTDHGVEDVSENVDLVPVLEGLGIRARRGTATRLFGQDLEEPLEDLEPYDALLAINGNLMNHIYLRSAPGPSGWRERVSRASLGAYRGRSSGAPVDLVAALRSSLGVELTVVRGQAETIEVHGRAGLGVITARDGGFVYEARGDDPLGYAQAPSARVLLDGQAHDARAWLEATASLEYPFAVVRLHATMTAPGAPDVLVTALPGFDLARDFELFVNNYHGGHGGLRAAQTSVPYVLAGPGVPRGRVLETALAEDVGATLFSLLGLEPSAQDGQPARVLGSVIHR